MLPANGRPPAGEAAPESSWGAWRDGDRLVLRGDARLPDRCVKTDLPAGGRTVDLALFWLEPRFGWLLLLGPIVYGAVARRAGTRVVVTVGITERALRASRRGWVLTWALYVAGAGLWVAAAVAALAALFWGGLALLALAVPAYLLSARLVRVTRLEDDRVWLAGVHPGYLARLPEWPG